MIGVLESWNFLAVSRERYRGPWLPTLKYRQSMCELGSYPGAGWTRPVPFVNQTPMGIITRDFKSCISFTTEFSNSFGFQFAAGLLSSVGKETLSNMVE